MFIKKLGCNGPKGAIVQSLKQRQWRYIIQPTTNNNNWSLNSSSSVNFLYVEIVLLLFDIYNNLCCFFNTLLRQPESMHDVVVEVLIHDDDLLKDFL